MAVGEKRCSAHPEDPIDGIESGCLKALIRLRDFLATLAPSMRHDVPVVFLMFVAAAGSVIFSWIVFLRSQLRRDVQMRVRTATTFLHRHIDSCWVLGCRNLTIFVHDQRC